MYTSSMSEAEFLDCRRYVRAVISASFLSSLRHVQVLKRIDESVENMRKRLSRSRIDNSIDTSSSTSPITPRLIPVKPRKKPKPVEARVRPTNWSPVTDGKKAIGAMIDQMWCVPYAPCQYTVQFICTVSLCALQRHKYCVRWQNGRRSAMFYVNIDETERETNVWVSFPEEIKAHRPHTSSGFFHRFLQRNLF